jgi:hypothetical protein
LQRPDVIAHACLHQRHRLVGHKGSSAPATASDAMAQPAVLQGRLSVCLIQPYFAGDSPPRGRTAREAARGSLCRPAELVSFLPSGRRHPILSDRGVDGYPHEHPFSQVLRGPQPAVLCLAFLPVMPHTHLQRTQQERVVSRACFALFRAAICALESPGDPTA